MQSAMWLIKNVIGTNRRNRPQKQGFMNKEPDVFIWVPAVTHAWKDEHKVMLLKDEAEKEREMKEEAERWQGDKMNEGEERKRQQQIERSEKKDMRCSGLTI